MLLLLLISKTIEKKQSKFEVFSYDHVAVKHLMQVAENRRSLSRKSLQQAFSHFVLFFAFLLKGIFHLHLLLSLSSLSLSSLSLSSHSNLNHPSNRSSAAVETKSTAAITEPTSTHEHEQKEHQTNQTNEEQQTTATATATTQRCRSFESKQDEATHIDGSIFPVELIHFRSSDIIDLIIFITVVIVIVNNNYSDICVVNDANTNNNTQESQKDQSQVLSKRQPRQHRSAEAVPGRAEGLPTDRKVRR